VKLLHYVREPLLERIILLLVLYSFVGYFYNYNVGFTPTLDQIEKGTRKCLIPAPNISVAPDTDDQILRGSDKVNIIHVVTAYSNGVALHYICDVVS
jgi:hypothetical protein